MTYVPMPCPFCDSDNVCLENASNAETDIFYVWCFNCRSQGPDTIDAESAFAAWDMRGGFPQGFNAVPDQIDG